MKKLLLSAIAIICLSSCSKDCEEADRLEEQYQQAIQNAGNSPAAIEQITRQYNERKRNLDC